MRWRSWLRRCATSQKVAGSIPYGFTVIFHWSNSFDRTMAIGLTQLLKEISTTNISWWVKAAGGYGWHPYHFPVHIVLKSKSFNLLEPSGPRPLWGRSMGQVCRSMVARLLRLWVRIPPGAWMFVCCECCVLSGRGLCDELITLAEESYRLRCVVVCDLEISWMRRPWPNGGSYAKR